MKAQQRKLQLQNGVANNDRGYPGGSVGQQQIVHKITKFVTNPKGRSFQGNYVLTSFGQRCGFNVSAKKRAAVILANMVAHKASIESEVILCNIGDPQLDTIILTILYSRVIGGINKFV